MRLRALAVLLLLPFLGLLPAVPAQAATSVGDRAVSEASHHRGQPYSYGAAGPSRFDCSGFTLYVFGRFGYRLPHNSQSQYDSVRRVPRGSERPGDLIFFWSGGTVGHVGIYAGNGQMWHAPRSGDVVRLAPLYSQSYSVGRVA